MPIYEYMAQDENKSCEKCSTPFEKLHKYKEEPLKVCPECGAPVKKLISNFGIAYGLDFKAKGTGLHKLVRRDKGTYEKMY